MTSVANYQVLRDTSVDLDRMPLHLDPNNELVLPFIWPDRMVTGDLSRRAIFSVRLIPDASIGWSVGLDGTTIISNVYHTAGEVISFQEVIDLTPFAGNYHPGQSVPVKILVHSGEARFSDIVIWYHTSLPTFVPSKR